MKSLRTAVCLLLSIFTLTFAGNESRLQGNVYSYRYDNRNSQRNSLKPLDWFLPYELESLPSLQEITFEKLEDMPAQKSAEMLNKLYHLIQIKSDFEPTFVPQPNEIAAHLLIPSHQKVSFMLNDLPRIVREHNKHFGAQEVTIFITGLPQESEIVEMATRKLVEAYMERYNVQAVERCRQKKQQHYDASEERKPSSSEEDCVTTLRDQNQEPTGILLVIDVGSAIPSFSAYAAMDIEEIGTMIGDVIVQLINMTKAARESVHIIGSNVGAHVAGAAGRHFSRDTGHQLRRITGLDPSKIYATKSHSLTGLARGDAEFVDVIHTSAYGMGTPARCGNADFYPNGPSADAAGADNIVEASMRAVLYYAGSVVPGYEYSFPAVSAISLMEYKNGNRLGKRVHMGIKTDFDIEGDFVPHVNAKSHTGRRTSRTTTTLL